MAKHRATKLDKQRRIAQFVRMISQGAVNSELMRYAAVEWGLSDRRAQEYIKEARGADIRCFVIGDKVVASMKRQAADGEFRSNLHRGGTASVIRITPEERSTAIRAAKAMGLRVAGVDLLRSNHGPVIMEVNSSPGLQGIESATGKDIAGMIIEHIEKNAVPARKAPPKPKG